MVVSDGGNTVILNFEFLIYAIFVGGLYLLLIGFLLGRLERLIPLFENFPKELIEPKNAVLFIFTFIVEFVFFVFMPAMIFHWFFTVIPFSGFRGGVAVALFLFMLGVIPFAILILFRIKLPVVYLLYQCLCFLIKMTGSLAIIGYLYSL
jgi:hypothetical protein